MSENILEELNTNQRRAVETVEGPLLINAGPGSGKTRVITHRIAYLVQACGIHPLNIAAVTFTNKAAAEMRERLHPLMGPYARDITVSTFHSFCAMLLRKEGHIIDLDREFTIYDDSDQIALVKRSMKEINVDPKQFSGRAVLSKISNAKSQLIGTEGLSMTRDSYFEEIVARVYERYEALLTQASAVDFDDLLLKAHMLLDRFPEVTDRYQTRYSHIMVDEFQDTNVAQYEIAKLLSLKYRKLCVVGDPDQSIYSWRNADIRNISSFQKDFPEATVIPLEENYRSTQTILDAAQKLILANSDRVEKALWTSNGRGAPIVVREGYTEKEEAYQVVSEAGRLVREEGYSLNDIAVMYRVNAQSRAVEDACLLHGIPYQLVGSLRFYQRQEVKDITAYLRLIVNRNDDISFARVVNLPTRGIGQRTLGELARLAKLSGTSMLDVIGTFPRGKNHVGALTARSVKSLQNFEALINELVELSKGLNLSELIDEVLERTRYKQHVLEEIERGEERWDNLQEFRNTTSEYGELNSGEALIVFLESISLVNDIDNLDEKADSLTLVTLHQAKGLEFPVVFIIGMEEGLLPHIRSLDDVAEMEEERRLCYVGVTRAKERLYLHRVFRRGFRGGTEPAGPSRFLTEMPQKLIATSTDSDRRMQGSISWRRNAKSNSTTGSQVSRESRPNPVSKGVKQPSESVLDLQTGDKVLHKIFGEGIVTGTKPSGEDVEITVAFKHSGGVKRLLLSFAPLEKMD